MSDTVRAQLPEMSSASYPTGGTVLFGPVRDEAGVLAVFERIAGLGLCVVEARRLPD